MGRERKWKRGGYGGKYDCRREREGREGKTESELEGNRKRGEKRRKDENHKRRIRYRAKLRKPRKYEEMVLQGRDNKKKRGESR